MAGKAKKLARKAETALANEHAATVRAACALADPLAPLPAAARVFSLAPPPSANAPAPPPPLHVRLVSSSASDLAPGLLDAAHALCRVNMEELYEPVWGPWDEAKKRRQLADGASRFILALASSEGGEEQGGGEVASAAAAAPPAARGSNKPRGNAGEDSSSPEDQGGAGGDGEGRRQGGQQQPQEQQLVALVNYRFEMDDAGGTGRGPGLPVAYCYEVQLVPSAQRRGLGRRLMRALELAAARAGMRGVVLTVLDANDGARALYGALGYALDPNSPDPDDADEAHAGYRILRKDFPEAVVTAAAAARAVSAAAAAGAVGGGAKGAAAAMVAAAAGGALASSGK